jgi:hypothetical protein
MLAGGNRGGKGDIKQQLASFSHQVAARVQDMFPNFYAVKTNINIQNSATTETREKINSNLESTKKCLTKF